MTTGDRVYVGTVEDNLDPEDRGRVRIRIDGMHDNIATADLVWSRVCVSIHGQGAGQNKPLLVGVDVCVAFEQGRAEQPIVIGVLGTTLDRRNVPSDSYVAGDDVRRVDGSDTLETARAQTQTGGTNLNQTFKGALRQAFGSASSKITGVWTGTFGGRKWTLGAEGGLDQLQFNGHVTRLLLEGADISVFKKVKAALVSGLEVSSFGNSVLQFLGGSLSMDFITPGGMTIRIRPPIPDPTGLSDLATLEVDGAGNMRVLTQAGFVTIGRVTTQGQAAVPVSKSTHTHLAVGNLGLPVVVPPSLPTPDNNSITVLVE